MQIPALKITQFAGGAGQEPLTIYVTAMTLGQMRGHVEVDSWSPSNPEGYQRPLVERRMREVAKYLLEEQGVFPTSVLLGTRPDEEVPVMAHGFDGEGPVTMGTLAFPDGSRLWIVDGQHRFYSTDYAYERGAESLDEYPFPISIMWDVDRYAEMLQFNIINTRQKKMSTDIVDRHLVQIQNQVGLGMVSTGARGERDYVRASATKVVDDLNALPGVWKNQIAVPGVPGRDQGLVRQHAMVVSIEPFMKDAWVASRTHEDKVKVLANFWAAAEEAWPDAFASPKDYRVQATVGVYSLHMALPSIIHRCLEDRDVTKEKMRELLVETGITDEFWSKENGDPYTLGTGMASIRALARHIVESLPEAGRTSVRL
jgi:DGQHR domain-containing protein